MLPNSLTNGALGDRPLARIGGCGLCTLAAHRAHRLPLFFAMKFSSDSYRFVMPTSADDRRPFRQEAAAPDRIEEKGLSRKKSALWIGVTMGLLLTGSSLALAQSARQPAQDGTLKSGPPV
jgi:hypothetical protein